MLGARAGAGTRVAAHLGDDIIESLRYDRSEGVPPLIIVAGRRQCWRDPTSTTSHAPVARRRQVRQRVRECIHMSRCQDASQTRAAVRQTPKSRARDRRSLVVHRINKSGNRARSKGASCFRVSSFSKPRRGRCRKPATTAHSSSPTTLDSPGLVGRQRPLLVLRQMSVFRTRLVRQFGDPRDRLAGRRSYIGIIIFQQCSSLVRDDQSLLLGWHSACPPREPPAPPQKRR